MKYRNLVFCLWLFSLLALPADVVELLDGTRIEGTILAEHADRIEIQVGTNETGTIRRVLIIDGSEIRTWMADAAGRGGASSAPEVNRLGTRQYIDRLLEEAQQKINAEDYDAGIREFGEAADIAGRDLDKLEPADQVAMLEVKAHAHRLQLAALKGKQKLLEEGLESMEDTLEKLQKDLEQEITRYQNDREDFEQRLTEENMGRLGFRRAQKELDEREADLKRKQNQFASFRQNSLARSQEMKRDLAQTEIQIGLAEERVERAEDEAKRMERSSRR